MHLLLALTTMLAQACTTPAPGLTPIFPSHGDQLIRPGDIYEIDPTVARSMRVVAATINRTGGTIAVPASDNVAVELTYPPSDACPDQKVRVEAIGPAGVKRLGSAIKPFGDGWQPFYELTIMFSGSSARRIRFGGFPELIVDVADARSSTIYAMRIEFGSGITQTDIDTGPRNQGNANRAIFSLSSIPWLNDDGASAVPLLGYRLIIWRITTTIRARSTKRASASNCPP